jgi:hypothetical protein
MKYFLSRIVQLTANVRISVGPVADLDEINIDLKLLEVRLADKERGSQLI